VGSLVSPTMFLAFLQWDQHQILLCSEISLASFWRRSGLCMDLKEYRLLNAGATEFFFLLQRCSLTFASFTLSKFEL